jgi:hypothetical protein
VGQHCPPRPHPSVGGFSATSLWAKLTAAARTWAFSKLSKRKASVLDPYVLYLVRRWNEGCRNGKRLYREIRERGYANSEETCARFVAQLRRAEARGRPPSSVPRERGGSVAGLLVTVDNQVRRWGTKSGINGR